jgi:hypothetical protein
LSGFYFGKQYIYTAKVIQFQDVYISIFPSGKAEDASNLQFLVWIRNDRNSNERFIDSHGDLDDFVSKFNQSPRSVTGVLQTPTKQVRDLTAEAYPGVNVESLRVLWAREFPSQNSTNTLWTLSLACLIATAICALAFRRQPRTVSAAPHAP